MITGDEKEEVSAERVEYLNHQVLAEAAAPRVLPTKFTFPGRAGADGRLMYSEDLYDQNDFNGYVEDLYDDRGEIREDYKNVYRFEGKQWNPYVNKERDNFDCLMGCNVDMSRPETLAKIIRWIKWYMKVTKANGVRIDAVKHISYKFMPILVEALRFELGDENLFAVAEYWDGGINTLASYLGQANNRMNLFDVALHYNLYSAATQTDYDLRILKHNTLLENRPKNAVTFVDNHDTEPAQALESFIPADWKQRAYALILYQQKGLPCVFYGDLYGINFDAYKEGKMSQAKAQKMENVENQPPVGSLGKMCCIRKYCAYGEQTDYFDNAQLVGYTRTGTSANKLSGMAVLISKRIDSIYNALDEGGKNAAVKKKMYVNRKFAGETFVNALNAYQTVTIDEDGCGEFFAEANTTSIWIRKKADEWLSRYRPGYRR